MQDWKDKNWVFIGGCSNSGTTIPMVTLRQHPNTANLMHEERYYLQKFKDSVLPDQGNENCPRIWAAKKPNIFHLTEKSDIDLKDTFDFLYSKFDAENKSYLVLKNPSSCLRMRLYQREIKRLTGNYPYIIYVIRNGYIVSAGIRKKSVVCSNIRTAAEQWRNSSRIILNDLEYIKKGIIVKYEDMTENWNIFTERICEFLDLENIKFDKPTKLLGSSGAPPLKEYKNRNHRDAYHRLTAKDIPIIREVAGDILDRFNYKFNDRWLNERP